MTATDSQPLSTNLQGQSWFKFQLQRAPSVSFFAHEVKIPDITNMAATYPTQFLNIPLTGDHLAYEALNITFQVDTNFQNWLEIHNWMTGLTSPSGNTVPYANMQNAAKVSPYGLYSEATLFITDSQRNPSLRFIFENTLPINLTGPQFTDTNNDMQYVSATATFKFTKYRVELP